MTEQVPLPLPPASPQEQEENEVLRATRELQAQRDAADAADEAAAVGVKRGIGWKAAAGIGIGSAAILAALLYANRDKLR